MELKNVKLKIKLEPQSGTGQQSGKEWSKQTFVFEETDTKYPKMIALTAWNVTAQEIERLPIDAELNCDIRVESREYQGKWYTDAILSTFKVVNMPAKTYSPIEQEYMAASKTVDPQASYDKEGGDLPF
jgi:hypothetical protein